MPIANARVDVGSQEPDVEHEPPIAENAQSIEKARFRKGMATGQDGQMLYKMRVQRDTSLDRLGQDAGKAPKLTRTDSKARGSIQECAPSNAVASSFRDPLLSESYEGLSHET